MSNRLPAMTDEPLSFNRTSGLVTLGEFERALLESLCAESVPAVMPLTKLKAVLEQASLAGEGLDSAPLTGLANTFLEQMKADVAALEG